MAQSLSPEPAHQQVDGVVLETRKSCRSGITLPIDRLVSTSQKAQSSIITPESQNTLFPQQTQCTLCAYFYPQDAVSPQNGWLASQCQPRCNRPWALLGTVSCAGGHEPLPGQPIGPSPRAASQQKLARQPLGGPGCPPAGLHGHSVFVPPEPGSPQGLPLGGSQRPHSWSPEPAATARNAHPHSSAGTIWPPGPPCRARP